METTRDINIRISFSRKSSLLLLAAFFLCWHPGFIGSETLQLTTYYPAPYGGYVSILTTGNTLLARDTGNVGVGTNAPTEKFEVNGNISSNMGGTLIYNTGGEGATIRMRGNNGTNVYLESLNGTLRVINHPWNAELMTVSQAGDTWVNRDLRTGRDLIVGRDLYVNGSIRGFCSRRGYGVGATVWCGANENIVGFLGDGVARISGFLPANSTTSSVGRYVVLGEDWGGTMICCRFN